MILRVKKRGDGRSASPTVRLKGERAPSERIPWELFGGEPRRCGSASVVQRPRGSGADRQSRNSCARARDGGGGMVCGVFGWWEVGGGGGEVRWFWGVGGREGWFLRGMVLHFVFVWFFKRLHPKKNRLFISLSKIQVIITFTDSAFTSKREILFL